MMDLGGENVQFKLNYKAFCTNHSIQFATGMEDKLLRSYGLDVAHSQTVEVFQKKTKEYHRIRAKYKFIFLCYKFNPFLLIHFQKVHIYDARKKRPY
jgi:hypothetical protein